MKKIIKRASDHKIVSAIIIIILVLGGYGVVRARSSAAKTEYVAGKVERGSVVSSVSGTGQVSAKNQIDVKAKTSGDLIGIRVQSGDWVSQGAVLAELDSSDQYIALRNAQISLEKLSGNSGDTAKNYDKALSDVTATFLDTPNILDGLKNIFDLNNGYLSDNRVRYIDQTALSYEESASREYAQAQDAYDALVVEYKSVSRTSSAALIESLVGDTYSAVRTLAQALKDTKTTVDYAKSKESQTTSVSAATAIQTNLTSWTEQINSHLSSVLGDKSLFSTDKLDVESAKLALDEKQKAYDDAFVRSPISGKVGKVDVKMGDSVSSGAIVATVVSSEQVAEISLNEVDAAKVKLGDKTRLTFDALPGLVLDGSVSELDLVGTQSQGVVTYAAKVNFGTQDSRVRPGMSVTADIVTDERNGVLVIPLSAVKKQGNKSSVQLYDSTLVSGGVPKMQAVELGLASDTRVEVLSGLTEGQEIVIRTVSTAKVATTGSTPSLFGGGGGGNRAASGAVRIGK